MKIYVDEMPECCLTCQLECPFEDRCVDRTTMDCDKCKGRPVQCPLRPVAEREAEVRKEVVESIKELAKDEFECLDCDEGYNTIDAEVYISSFALSVILDQVERREK